MTFLSKLFSQAIFNRISFLKIGVFICSIYNKNVISSIFELATAVARQLRLLCDITAAELSFCTGIWYSIINSFYVAYMD
jgi:hypothetical protein